PNGNTAAVTDSLGGRTEYMYDAANRMFMAQQTAATGPFPALDKRVDFDLNRAGLVEHIRRYSDLAETQRGFTTDFAYDCSGCPQRVTDIHHKRFSDGSTIAHFIYDRDAAGRIRTITDSEGVHNYTLDALGQILAVDHPAGGSQPDELYTYDA